MVIKGIPFNTSQLYYKHTLYNGCLLYMPLIVAENKPQVKAHLDAFNKWQMEQFKPEPEIA